MPVKPIPEGYHSVTPYLIVRGAADAIEFYKKAFGAVEETRLPAPDGKVMHAMIRIGGAASTGEVVTNCDVCKAAIPAHARFDVRQRLL